ncbi:MAG: hypothetical protein RLO50_15065 [Azospirillaceae bacterium]
MTNKHDKDRPTLANEDITTRRSTRRGILRGALAAAAGGVALAVTGEQQPALAAADVDSGSWRDRGDCPRGYGGVWTGINDSDTGTITDRSGYGRGAPYC